MCVNDKKGMKDTKPAGGDERHAIDMLINALIAIINNHRQQVNSDIIDRVMDLNRQMAHIASANKQTASAVELVAAQVANLMNQAGTTEAALRENTALSESYYEAHIVEPTVRVLFPIVDLLDDARTSGIENAVAIDTSAMSLADGIYAQLSLFLDIQGIAMLRHGPTDRFDPFVMRPVKVVEASVAELDSCVAQSLQTGFRLITSKRILRPESVILYRYRTDKS